MMFNKYDEKALTNPDTTHPWYVDKALDKRTFETFMRGYQCGSGFEPEIHRSLLTSNCNYSYE